MRLLFLRSETSLLTAVRSVDDGGRYEVKDVGIPAYDFGGAVRFGAISMNISALWRNKADTGGAISLK